jgi:hypothetical protein
VSPDCLIRLVILVTIALSLVVSRRQAFDPSVRRVSMIDPGPAIACESHLPEPERLLQRPPFRA